MIHVWEEEEKCVPVFVIKIWRKSDLCKDELFPEIRGLEFNKKKKKELRWNTYFSKIYPILPIIVIMHYIFVKLKLELL